MDEPIVPRATMRQRGAEAFDRGLSIDDHGMNPWAPAVADWRKGWLERRAEEFQAKQAKFCADQVLILAMGMLGEVSPP